MKCSELRQHLYNMHIIDDNKCICGLVETSEHFLFHCPLYTAIRTEMRTSFEENNIDFKINIVLNGDVHNNNKIIKVVDTYLSDSKRFSLLS